MMETKTFGVKMEDIQKLHEFQFLLKKRKIIELDNIEFLGSVQFKSELILIPVIVKIAVAATTIHLIDELTKVPKCRIFKLISNNKQVIVKLKRPALGVGSFLTLDFPNVNKKQEFLDSIGEIEDDGSDSSENSDDTPPNSDSSEENS